MGSALPRLLVSTVLALTAVASGSAPQETGTLPASTSPAQTAAATATPQLGLGSLLGPWPGEFALFHDHWLPLQVDALIGPPTLWGGATGPARPALVGLRSFGLSMRFGEESGPDGKRRLVFAPLGRAWDDLTGWEKFAVTLQYAGAAAAVGHFAGKLVH